MLILEIRVGLGKLEFFKIITRDPTQPEKYKEKTTPPNSNFKLNSTLIIRVG